MGIKDKKNIKTDNRIIPITPNLAKLGSCQNFDEHEIQKA